MLALARRFDKKPIAGFRFFIVRLGLQSPSTARRGRGYAEAELRRRTEADRLPRDAADAALLSLSSLISLRTMRGLGGEA